MSSPSPPSLQALAGLARAVAFDTRLDVVEGPAGGGWSLDPADGCIRCDPDDLKHAHGDDVRSLVCHEAAHWAVTRYPQLVPRAVLRAPGVAALLNALEDCRIETWLARRFPGTASWIARTNDRLVPVSLEGIDGQPLSHQFCMAAILEWWQDHSATSLELPPLDERVVDVLRRTAAARAEAVSIQPPVHVWEADGQAYEGSPVARRFAAVDARRPPDPFERAVRCASWSWWGLVHRGIRPAYEELVAVDRRERPAIVDEDERFVRRLRGLAPGGAYGSEGARRPASQPGEAGTGEGAPGSVARQLLAADAPSSYERARRRVAPWIHEASQALLPIVTRGAMPTWGGAHASGGRVDLRRVMQGEADPRMRRHVWQRKSLPVRRDPVVHVLLDVSGSMAGSRIEEAFAAVVLLVEVLGRLGIPSAVSGFQDRRIRAKRPRDPLDASTRARLGALPLEVVGRRAGGHNRPAHNHDGPAVWEAACALLDHPAQERWLWVLSDGLPTGPGDGVQALHDAVARIRADGRVKLVGIGVGPGTDHVGAFYDDALAEVPLADLPAALGELVAQRVVRPL